MLKKHSKKILEQIVTILATPGPVCPEDPPRLSDKKLMLLCDVAIDVIHSRKALDRKKTIAKIDSVLDNTFSGSVLDEISQDGFEFNEPKAFDEPKA